MHRSTRRNCSEVPEGDKAGKRKEGCQTMDMREQKFGIEIEMTGITRQRAAEVMAAYFPL